MSEETFDQCAIVELMGHVRLAGRVTETSLFGTTLCRVDIPDTPDQKGFTRLVGGSAIYAVTPCSEEVAKLITLMDRPKPIGIYEIRELTQLALQAPQAPIEGVDTGPDECMDDPEQYGINDDGVCPHLRRSCEQCTEVDCPEARAPDEPHGADALTERIPYDPATDPDCHGVRSCDECKICGEA